MPCGVEGFYGQCPVTLPRRAVPQAVEGRNETSDIVRAKRRSPLNGPSTPTSSVRFSAFASRTLRNFGSSLAAAAAPPRSRAPGSPAPHPGRGRPIRRRPQRTARARHPRDALRESRPRSASRCPPRNVHRCARRTRLHGGGVLSLKWRQWVHRAETAERHPTWSDAPQLPRRRGLLRLERRGIVGAGSSPIWISEHSSSRTLRCWAAAGMRSGTVAAGRVSPAT